MYMYTCRAPKTHGSVHGAELNYCFNTLSMSQRDFETAIPDEDQHLADLMSSSWAQFAHHGNPNTEGLPVWQPYNADNGELMVFDHNCYIRNNPDRELQQIIDRHCFRQLDEFRKTHP